MERLKGQYPSTPLAIFLAAPPYRARVRFSLWMKKRKGKDAMSNTRQEKMRKRERQWKWCDDGCLFWGFIIIFVCGTFWFAATAKRVSLWGLPLKSQIKILQFITFPIILFTLIQLVSTFAGHHRPWVLSTVPSEQPLHYITHLVSFLLAAIGPVCCSSIGAAAPSQKSVAPHISMCGGASTSQTTIKTYPTQL